MSQQTDELLLMHTVETNADGEDLLRQKAVSTQEQQIDRERLRWLTDLQKHPGYKMFMEAVKFEAKTAFLGMDKADNPTRMARLSGEHYAAEMMLMYVDTECKVLSARIKGAS